MAAFVISGHLFFFRRHVAFMLQAHLYSLDGVGDMFIFHRVLFIPGRYEDGFFDYILYLRRRLIYRFSGKPLYVYRCLIIFDLVKIELKSKNPMFKRIF